MPPRLYKHDPNASPVPTRANLKIVGIPEILPSTKLVSVRQAAAEIAANKGWNISEETIRENCRSGKWLKGHHWVKPGRNYLINLEAVYWSIVQ